MSIKPGDRVVMNRKYDVPREDWYRIWKVVSVPCSAQEGTVVLLLGRKGGYPVDGLEVVLQEV